MYFIKIGPLTRAQSILAFSFYALATLIFQDIGWGLGFVHPLNRNATIFDLPAMSCRRWSRHDRSGCLSMDTRLMICTESVLPKAISVGW